MISWINTLLLSRLDKYPSRWVLFLLAGAGTVLFVHGTSSYVRVDASTGVLRLRVPASFQRLDVTLRDSAGIVNATLGPERVSDLRVGTTPEEPTESRDTGAVLQRVDIDEHDGTFTIHKPPENAHASSRDSFFAIDIPHRSKYPIDILSLTLDARGISSDEVLRSYVANEERRLMPYRLGQDWIERIVSRTNEFIGNYVVTAMTIVCLWMALPAVGLTFHYWMPSAFRKALATRIKSPDVEAINDTRREYFEQFQQIATAQRFLRVLGPALGFLFTVTSLVAGIRPETSADGIRELGTLFSSLQLALISTVVGLIMRLLAMWRLRIERELLDRAADYFDERERELNPDGSQEQSNAAYSMVTG